MFENRPAPKEEILSERDSARSQLKTKKESLTDRLVREIFPMNMNYMQGNQRKADIQDN